MKKLLITLLLSLSLITGCDMLDNMDNTPTKKVEEYLNKYQTLHDDVINEIDDSTIKDSDFTEDQIKEYKDIVKNNYQKMTYKIKDEKIDGDKATVTTEIVVIDYTKSLSDIEEYYSNMQDQTRTIDEEATPYTNDNDVVEENNEGNDEMSFAEYKLKKLKETKDKATYTVDFVLVKNNGEWVLNEPGLEIKQKINGIYK
jgi:hypothetical protein